MTTFHSLRILCCASLLVAGGCTTTPDPIDTLEHAASALHAGDAAALLPYVNIDSLTTRLATDMTTSMANENAIVGLFGGLAQSMLLDELRSSFAKGMRQMQGKTAKPTTGAIAFLGDGAKFNGYGRPVVNGNVATVEARFTVKAQRAVKPLNLTFELSRNGDAWRITGISNIVEVMKRRGD